MHEDLNRVVVKKYIEEKDFVPGSSEEEYYKTCKANFLARNNSYIQEIFYGMFRTVTTCPNCKHVSLKFEEFSMLSVPIKSLSKTSSTLTFYYLNEFSIFEMTRVEYTAAKNHTLLEMKERFAKKVNVEVEDINLYVFERGVANKNSTFNLIDKTQLKHTISEVQLEADTFFFMVYDRPENLWGDSPITIYFDLNIKDKHNIVGLTKPIRCSRTIKIRKLYEFFYDCIRNLFPAKYQDFMQDFSEKIEDRPFNLLKGPTIIYLKNGEDNTTITLADNDTIVVELLDQKVKQDPRLCQLPPELRMKIFECQPGIFDCLDAMTNAEELDDDNKWFCGECKGHKKANIQMKIKELPPILIIHLKRLRKGNSSIVKISEKVDFPLRDLDMSRFTTEPNREDNKRPYHLFGVVSHIGSALSGHYTSQVLSGDTWTECNDSQIGLSIPGPTQAQTAYILFYRRDP